MAMLSFLTPANGASTPGEVERRRKLAEALMQNGMDSSPISSPWQAAARLASAFSGTIQRKRADAAEAAGRKSAASVLAAAMSGSPVDYQSAAENPWIDPEKLMNLQNTQGDIAWDKESRSHEQGLWPSQDAYNAAKMSNEVAGWDRANAQNDAWTNYIKTLPADEQAKANAMGPDVYFKGNGTGQGANGIYGNVYWDANGNPYALEKDGTKMRRIPVEGGAALLDPEATSFARGKGNASGKLVGETQAAIPGAETSASFFKQKANELLNDPDLGDITGYNSYVPTFLSTDKMVDLRSKVDQLGGGAFLEARNQLKGGGSITDFESRKAEDAYSRIQKALAAGDTQYLKQAIIDYVDAIDMGLAKLKAIGSQTAPAPQGSSINDLVNKYSSGPK